MRAVRPSAPREVSVSQSGFDDESRMTPQGSRGHTADDDNSPQTTQYDARRARSRTEEITKRDDQ